MNKYALVLAFWQDVLFKFSTRYAYQIEFMRTKAEKSERKKVHSMEGSERPWIAVNKKTCLEIEQGRKNWK